MFSPRLHVHLLPSLVPRDDLRGSTVVVIDVLRATTTIAYALAAGAAGVIPCLEVEEARRVAEELRAASRARDDVVLGGERHGTRIDGFDLGNSPAEYSAETVGGRTVVFTTTNGTAAMRHAQLARRILIGALVNAAALRQVLRDEPVVDLLCAGTQQRVSREDVLLAGALVDQLEAPGHFLNDSARIARDAWRSVAAMESDDKSRRTPSDEQLGRVLLESLGGQNLRELGFEADIALAARQDQLWIVPELHLPTGTIVPLAQPPRPA